MKHLIIIGASGFGRDIYEMAIDSVGYNVEYDIKGFLVHKEEYLGCLESYTSYPQILGTIYNYEIMPDDVFINSLGDLKTKKETTEYMLSKGAIFTSIIHKTAKVSPSTIIGLGSIIEPFAFIGSGAKLGDHCLIQTSSIVGHDCIVGNFSRVDCNSVLTGGAIIGSETVIHTSAVINQKTHVGSNCVVGACSFVIRKVKDGDTVYGNPARKL